MLLSSNEHPGGVQREIHLHSGMRVPGEAFQISTVEAHDAMVKFGSMPQCLGQNSWAETLIEFLVSGLGSPRCLNHDASSEDFLDTT